MVNATGFFVGVVVLLFGACSVQAEQKPPGFCENISSLANTIMTRRQAGVEMSRLIKSIDEAPVIAVDDIAKADSEKIDELAKGFVIQSYKFPLLHDEELKVEAVIAFENSVYLECYQARKK